MTKRQFFVQLFAFIIAGLALPFLLAFDNDRSALALPVEKKLKRIEQLQAIVVINGDFDFHLSKTKTRPIGKGWKRTPLTFGDYLIWARRSS